MKVPVNAVLDLWSLGHSATDIAGRLGASNYRQIIKIVAQARTIKDPRAVLHRRKGGRLCGRIKHVEALIARWPEIEIVESLTYACGHSYIGGERCTECARANAKLKYRAQQGSRP